MTFDELEGLIARVEIRNFTYPLHVVTRRWHGTPPRMDIVFFAMVKHRDTGEFVSIEVSHSVDEAQLQGIYGEDFVIDWLVYRPLREFVAHELDEAFHFDGKRLHDPHIESQKAR